ncbi:hypothetical protein MUA23_09320 [Mammaliicoccus sciuri]|uniref:hypothetical protein n=1 Tax=Mammaliicoccus sciuri TaxID=1296 RepID=UPI0021CFA390|nr:hypothetical protein [Mammaliicoccus sciuri]UXU71027.1 hypothetical protein MUA23_09320 [Mammaliicoccus sciuri]
MLRLVVTPKEISEYKLLPTLWIWCMINIKTGEIMKDKMNLIPLAVLGLFAFVLFFGFVLSNIDPNNKLEAYTLAISFVGIFATFGGAYLGAKISAKNAVEIVEIDRKANKFVLFQTLIQIYEKYDKLAHYYGIIEPSTDDFIKYSSDLNIKKNIIKFKDSNIKNVKYEFSEKYDEILSLFEKIISDKYLYYFINEFDELSYKDLVTLIERIKEEKKEVICYFEDNSTDNKANFSEFIYNELFIVNHKQLYRCKNEAVNILTNNF